MSQVDAVKTPASAAEVLRALLDAGVPREASTMLAAQSAFETAGWAAMWNWNAGNITHAGDSFDWTILPGNGLHFRSYGSLQDGVDDFVAFVTKRGLIPYAESNDLAGYVSRLQAINYAGSDPNSYPSYRAGMARWIKQLGGVVPASSWKTITIVAAIVIAGGAAAYAIETGLADKFIMPRRRRRRRFA